MKELLAWVKKHKLITCGLLVLFFVFPLIVVHVLFKSDATNSWFEATWESGDLLAYIAGFESLLGTVILGAITVYQSEKANEVNERLNKENNYLQRISIQQILPVLKVADLSVHKTKATKNHDVWKSNTVEVTSHYTRDKREPHISAYLPLLNNGQGFHKQIELTLENISTGPISQVSVDRIEFSGFNYKDSRVGKASCIGVDKIKYINWLILPDDQLKVIVDIYFDNDLYNAFWELDDYTSIGCFDICFYFTNTSLSGIEYKEKIYIEKGVGFKEKIMYKAYE